MSIKIIMMDETILKKNVEEFIRLKNYSSILHFKKDIKTIDEFNRKKTKELYLYIPEEKAYLFGAFDEDNLIGFIWGYPRTFFDEKRIFINSLVVNKSYEKKGIGKQLLVTMSEFAIKEKKIVAIDLTVDPQNVNAVGFYRHLGFSPERVQLRLGLEENLKVKE